MTRGVCALALDRDFDLLCSDSRSVPAVTRADRDLHSDSQSMCGVTRWP